MSFTDAVRTRLETVSRALVNQQPARIIVPAMEARSGFWFGGGNLTEDADGNLYLVGRYRNAGDSRLGVAAGTRGLELAIFISRDRGARFEKLISFSKSDLDVAERQVLSIEGSALRWTDRGVELYVSTEKDNIGYPPGYEAYLKPGTGVWTIERLSAGSIQELADAAVETVLECRDLRFLHVKDPFLYEPPGGPAYVLFCTHPFCWTSSNTGYGVCSETPGVFSEVRYDFFPRGFTWDVAMSRGTAILDLPQIGCLQDRRLSLLFYDGGECVRNLDEHQAAVHRPRGYSCEELGGVACFETGRLDAIQRLSVDVPMFVSPQGTGCSRYVDVHRSSDGYYVTWQQSQADLSQPLVMNFVSHDEMAALLS